MGNSDRFFFDRFGLTEANLSQYLGAALSEGGEYADLYFEHTTSSSLLVDESLVKTATEGISMGCGVRVVAGEQTGYAYTDDLAPEKILKAAKIAGRIASGPARVSTVGLSALDAHHDFYPRGACPPRIANCRTSSNWWCGRISPRALTIRASSRCAPLTATRFATC